MPPVRSVAFVSPRFAEGPTVGGAETLLKTLASYAREAGLDVTFLATCARNHFTWANELPAGRRDIDGLPVRFFPVDADRDVTTFLRVQTRISRGSPVSDADALSWLRHSVNSTPLCDHLRDAPYDRIVIGPYLFGLSYFAAGIHPRRTWLVPCLHDEAFAYLPPFKPLFQSVRGSLFNSEPERELAARLYGPAQREMPVVGMGIPPFEADPAAFARRRAFPHPYVLYSGRREPMKGTPLLLDYLAAFRARTGRDIKLVLTGSGAIEPPPALAPHVLDLGFVSEQEKREAMAGALAFCHPSLNESFGIVLLESWLAGTPGLVHAGSAVLQHQCRAANGGLWFRTYADFEEQLKLLMDRRDIRDALGRAGRRYVLDTYAPARVARRLLESLGAP